MARLPQRLPKYGYGSRGIPDLWWAEDNEKFYFGDDKDASLYWDGSVFNIVGYTRIGSSGTSKYGLGQSNDLYVNGDVEVNSTSYFDGEVRFYHKDGVRWYETGNYIGFMAPALTSDTLWTWPDDDGTAGQVLQTDGSEHLSWGDKTTDTNTKEFFIPVDWSDGTQGATGDFHRWNLAETSTRSAYISFFIPADFTSVTSAEVVVIIGGVGDPVTIIYQIDTDFGADTEAYNTHSTTTGAITLGGVGSGNIQELPITTTGMAAGDYVGVKITEAGDVESADFDVIGIRFKYT